LQIFDLAESIPMFKQFIGQYLMMLAVDQKVEPDPEGRPWRRVQVEYKPVDRVFNNGPQQHAKWQHGNCSRPGDRTRGRDPGQCARSISGGKPHHEQAVGYPAKWYHPPRTFSQYLKII